MSLYRYKLTNLHFNNGTEIQPGPLTVICGPNNVGKSRTLKEIRDFCTAHTVPPSVILSSVDWSVPSSLEELRASYYVERAFISGGWTFSPQTPELVGTHHMSGGGEWPESYEKAWTHYIKPGNRSFASNFGTALLAFLKTENRLQMVKECNSPETDRLESTILHSLYNCSRDIELKIRTIVKEAFSHEIALDFTGLKSMKLRVGDDFSHLPPDPRDAKKVFEHYPLLDEQGDGLRSFAGIITALLSINRGVFLIDEPEAFLHPPQAYRIGEFLATHSSENRQIILATHSEDVLRGIISKTREVTIIRMDRNGIQNTFRQLEPKRLQELISDPLLSSARVLDGLFYAGAVVVEADSDARFYHTVSRIRSPQLDLHFVNADNKQTVSRIVRLYHDLAVKAVGIVDFDILNSSVDFKKSLEELETSGEDQAVALKARDAIGDVAKEMSVAERFAKVKQGVDNLALAAKVTEEEASTSEPERADQLERFLRQVDNRCRTIVDSTKGWKKLKEEGREALPDELRVEFDELSSLCIKYGLLIVPTGQLESMLADYGIDRTTDKRGWISKALRLLGGLSVDDSKHPWRFIVEVHKCLGIHKND